MQPAQLAGPQRRSLGLVEVAKVAGALVESLAVPQLVRVGQDQHPARLEHPAPRAFFNEAGSDACLDAPRAHVPRPTGRGALAASSPRNAKPQEAARASRHSPPASCRFAPYMHPRLLVHGAPPAPPSLPALPPAITWPSPGSPCAARPRAARGGGRHYRPGGRGTAALIYVACLLRQACGPTGRLSACVGHPGMDGRHAARMLGEGAWE